MFVQGVHSILHLFGEIHLIFNQLENLLVFPCNLPGEVRVYPLDQREHALAQHLLLLCGRSGGQHGDNLNLLLQSLDFLLQSLDFPLQLFLEGGRKGRVFLVN